MQLLITLLFVLLNLKYNSMPQTVSTNNTVLLSQFSTTFTTFAFNFTFIAVQNLPDEGKYVCINTVLLNEYFLRLSSYKHIEKSFTLQRCNQLSMKILISYLIFTPCRRRRHAVTLLTCSARVKNVSITYNSILISYHLNTTIRLN
jgi:hypothetical protein